MRVNKSWNRLAWLLDNSIRIPGTSIKMGLDALLGLIPGLGDVAGSALSTYILIQAVNAGMPAVVLVRMGVNILFDTLLGMLPLVGDIFDITFKANLRNVELINQHYQAPEESLKRNTLAVLFISLFFVSILIFAIWLAFKLFGRLMSY